MASFPKLLLCNFPLSYLSMRLSSISRYSFSTGDNSTIFLSNPESNNLCTLHASFLPNMIFTASLHQLSIYKLNRLPLSDLVVHLARMLVAQNHEMRHCSPIITSSLTRFKTTFKMKIRAWVEQYFLLNMWL